MFGYTGKTACNLKQCFWGRFLGFVVGLTLGLSSYLFLGTWWTSLVILLVPPILGWALWDRKINLEAAKLRLERSRQEQLRQQELQRIEEEYLRLRQEKEEKRLQRLKSRERRKNRESRSALIHYIFTLSGYAARSEGRITERHIENAENIMRMLKIEGAEREEAISCFTFGSNPKLDENAMLSDIADQIGRKADYLKFMLQFVILSVAQGGVLSEQAASRFRKIASSLGVGVKSIQKLLSQAGSEARFASEFDKTFSKKQSDDNTKPKADAQSALGNTGGNNDSAKKEDTQQQEREESFNDNSNSGVRSKLEEALDILELDKNSTLSDVKRSYKKLMFKFHPDRLASQGLSEEMLMVYTEKAKAIQGAFEYIKKEFGI